MSHWTIRLIPDQTARIAAITGADSGIGFETANALADRGAIVVWPAGNPTKAQRAVAQIGGDTSYVQVNLASLASIRRAASELRSRHTAGRAGFAVGDLGRDRRDPSGPVHDRLAAVTAGADW